MIRCANRLPRDGLRGCCLGFLPCRGLLLPFLELQNGTPRCFLRCHRVLTTRLTQHARTTRALCRRTALFVLWGPWVPSGREGGRAEVGRAGGGREEWDMGERWARTQGGW